MMQRKVPLALNTRHQRKVTHESQIKLCNLHTSVSKESHTLCSQKSTKHVSLKIFDKHLPKCQNTIKVSFLFFEVLFTKGKMH